MTTAAPAWTVAMCRSTPGAADVAEIAAARGAAVIWCGPDCCGGTEAEDDVSVYDDGTDLGPDIPAEETRGGENPDWEHARPGEPLPELPEPEEKLPDDWAPEPGWGLT